MLKGYLNILLPISFFFTSHSGGNDPFFPFQDSTSKVTNVYPNPATAYINFTFDKSVDRTYTFQVYSFIGKKMSETRITEAKLTINFDDTYFRGIYVYQLRDQTGRIVESGKFQVNR